MASLVNNLSSQTNGQDLSAIPATAPESDASQTIGKVATASAAIPLSSALTRVIQFPHGSRTVLQSGVLVQIPLPPPRRAEGMQTLQDLPQEDSAINEMRETVRNSTELLREMGEQMQAEAPRLEQTIADTRQARADTEQMIVNTRDMTGRLDRLIGTLEEREAERARQAARAAKDAEQIAALEETNRRLDQRLGTNQTSGTVQPATITTEPSLLSWENWRVITGIALRVITLIAIAAIYGMTPASLLGAGMIMEIGFRWLFAGPLENLISTLTSNNIQALSMGEVPSPFQN
jgi:hypothetical protein